MTTLTTETIDNLRLYESKMLEKRQLEAELDALKEQILPHMPEEPIETDTGVFKLKPGRLKYTYSVPTQELEKGLQARKKREEQDGTATAEAGASFLEYREKGSSKQ